MSGSQRRAQGRADGPFRVWTMQELMDADAAWTEDFHGSWGPWRLNAENLTLVLTSPEGYFRYAVDLERCLTSAETLDWIFQVAGKRYAEEDDAVLTGLVRALDEVLYPQAHLCSGGMDKTLSRAQVAALVERALAHGVPTTEPT